ncbi:MAG TPA: TadE/TadG family type IV pilus assembly protein [Pirellulaceae bacterium]|nr:TadE/TadG family type IV pilus assembly protein [Pirellulaceae bacterium]
MNDSHVRRRRYSEGTTIVETAIILPVFITFIFGLIAYGHAQMVSNMLKGATRSAARYGATEGVTSAQTTARLKDIMASGVNSSLISVQIKDAKAYDTGSTFPNSLSAVTALPNLELSSAGTRQLFCVSASVDYNSVAILPISWLKNKTFHSEAFMRHE